MDDEEGAAIKTGFSVDVGGVGARPTEGRDGLPDERPTVSLGFRNMASKRLTKGSISRLLSDESRE